jgi:hypothetical protein
MVASRLPKRRPFVHNLTIVVKGLIRFGLIWVISLLLTPYVNRLFDRLAERAPKGSFLEDALLELSGRYSSALIRSFGESLGELVLGEKSG